MALAVMVGLSLGHGTAHMSTRAWKRGLVLAASQVNGWVQLGNGHLRLGVALVLATMGLDIVGALLEISQTASNLPVATVRKRS